MLLEKAQVGGQKAFKKQLTHLAYEVTSHPGPGDPRQLEQRILEDQGRYNADDYQDQGVERGTAGDLLQGSQGHPH